MRARLCWILSKRTKDRALSAGTIGVPDDNTERTKAKPASMDKPCHADLLVQNKTRQGTNGRIEGRIFKK